MKSVNIGIAGAGVVGSEVIRIIESSKDEILKKVGITLNIKSIYTRTPESDKSIDIYRNNRELFKGQVNELYNDPDIDLIVETIGGLGISKNIIEQSLNNGKSVITANKDLIASNGKDLLDLADKNGVTLKYEAAVAGGIPIINALQGGVIGDEITEIRGIMNGTCNYMLTELENGGNYESMLRKAKELGYAESDPTNDVEGIDTAYKLAILMSVLFGKFVSIDDINVDGISKLTEVEFKYARLLEKKIKLLGVISNTRSKISAFVSPVLLDRNSRIAKTDGVLNAIELVGKNATTFYSGPGAGGKATASAIISDLINVAKFTENGQYFGEKMSNFSSNLELLEKQDIDSKFYCRFHIKDQKGVLASITSIFAKYDINIDQVIQHNHAIEEKENLPFVITLEKTKKLHLDSAINEIDNLEFITEPTFVMLNLD